MKVYAGRVTQDGRHVVEVIDGNATPARGRLDTGKVRTLKPRLDLFNHSPSGFCWGYAGSGPAQLALALLADALGDDQRAVRLHQRYKFKVVAHLQKDRGFHITDADVRRVVADIEAEQRARASL